jgi:hypothetical protein
VTGWAAGERREGQVCREVYLSKEVVVQEKGASEAQEEDGMDLGQRKVCPWGMGERERVSLSPGRRGDRTYPVTALTEQHVLGSRHAGLPIHSEE